MHQIPETGYLRLPRMLGNPYALAQLSVPMGDEGCVWCLVIAFQEDAVARLLQMRAGTLKVRVYSRSPAAKPGHGGRRGCEHHVEAQKGQARAAGSGRRIVR